MSDPLQSRPPTPVGQWWLAWFGCTIGGPLLAVLVLGKNGAGFGYALVLMVLVFVSMLVVTLRLGENKTGGSCLLMMCGAFIVVAVFFFGCAARL